MAKEWICLMVNTTFHHGDKEAAEQEIQKIFRDDLVDAKLVCDEAMQASGEYYAFVCCSNYEAHIEDVVISAAVARVVPSYDRPHLLSDADVKSFVSSVLDQYDTGDFTYGDVVRVKEHGHLDNLYGLVVSPGRRSCKVFFRFHMHSFSQSISVTSLERVDNVLEQMRVAPFSRSVQRSSLFRKDMASKAKEAVKNIVNGDKIYRKEHRAYEQAYGRL